MITAGDEVEHGLAEDFKRGVVNCIIVYHFKTMNMVILNGKSKLFFPMTSVANE